MLLTALAACQGTPIDVEIRFESVAGTAPFGCGDPAQDLGDPPGAATAQFLELYISEVAVVSGGTSFPVTLTADGRFQSDTVALVDLSDGTGTCVDGSERHDAVVGTAPAGAQGWDELQFSVGVPEGEDHLDLDAAAPPLADPELWWSWTLGYKFMRWELATATGEWQLHLGSGECSGSDEAGYSCQLPNRPTVDLADVQPGDVVAIDAAALLAGSDLASGGCFSDDVAACGPPFAALGLPFEGTPSAGQAVFRVGPE